MKLYFQSLYLLLALLGSEYTARCQGGNSKLVIPFLKIECQTNCIVKADLEHPASCPPGYTNLLLNPNLFSVVERSKIFAIKERFSGVTTNCGLRGTVFVKSYTGYVVSRGRLNLQGKWETGPFTNTFPVFCFDDTNSMEKIELTSRRKVELIAKVRTPQGDGYDAQFVNGAFYRYIEHKNYVPDGLFVILQDSNHPKDFEHCGMWSRFEKGKIVGTFLLWNRDGSIGAWAEFKESFDFLKCAADKMDLSWLELH